MHLYRTHLAPEGDGGTSGGSQTAVQATSTNGASGDTSGGTQTAPAQGAATTQTQPDIETIRANATASGITIHKERRLAELAALGIPIQERNGKPSLSETQRWMAAELKKATTVATTVAAGRDDENQALKARVVALEKINTEQTEKMEKAAEAAKKSKVAAEVKQAFGKLPILPINGSKDAGIDLAKDTFLTRYRVEELASGEMRVYRGNNIVTRADGGIATVDEAARIFLEELGGALTASTAQGRTGERAQVTPGQQLMTSSEFGLSDDPEKEKKIRQGKIQIIDG